MSNLTYLAIVESGSRKTTHLDTEVIVRGDVTVTEVVDLEAVSVVYDCFELALLDEPHEVLWKGVELGLAQWNLSNGDLLN
jgi:hypothetical protein